MHFLENGETSSIPERVGWLSQMAVLADSKDDSMYFMASLRIGSWCAYVGDSTTIGV